MVRLHQEVPKKIWSDKRIAPEGKLIYTYIYSKGMNRYITDINVGELQQVVKISNKGLRNYLEQLEDCKYLLQNEYSTGMYSIKLLG